MYQMLNLQLHPVLNAIFCLMQRIPGLVPGQDVDGIVNSPYVIFKMTYSVNDLNLSYCLKHVFI